ncbi:MAG: transcription elongation factor GreA [Mucinivorans sp.]
MAQINHTTKEGYDKLMTDLAALRAQRVVISAQIGEARDKGDLSENAEYDAAREAQGMLEMRIAKLEATISSSRIIDTKHINNKTVQILNKVTIKNLKTNAILEYTLVSESEANLREKKLSIHTPIAKALMGKKKGDLINITVPGGVLEVELLDISI